MRSEEHRELPPGADPLGDPPLDGEVEASAEAELDGSDERPEPREPAEPELDELEAAEPTGLGYATVDVFVVLFALGLLALSIAALMWVLG
jgi:hypothetical protein